MTSTDEDPGPAAPGGLQFDKAEFSPGGARSCKRCSRLIHDEYFESTGNILCRACAEHFGAGSGSSLDFWRAVAYGAGAAIVGTVIWLAVFKISGGSEYGIIAIAVGLLVGFAVRKGSLGRGGAKYQALAMALTYMSITSSYVPLVLKSFAEAAKEDAANHRVAKEGEPQDEPATGKAAAVGGDKKESVSAGELALAVAMVFGLAFAAPFLAGVKNVIGILIIGIALYEAWKINRKVPISGPFRIGSGARAGPALVPPTSP
jgi:hypothetical protein